MDGARVTFLKDAHGNVLPEQRDEQLVLPMRSLGDGIFMHPNQVIIAFFSGFEPSPGPFFHPLNSGPPRFGGRRP